MCDGKGQSAGQCARGYGQGAERSGYGSRGQSAVEVKVVQISLGVKMQDGVRSRPGWGQSPGQ